MRWVGLLWFGVTNRPAQNQTKRTYLSVSTLLNFQHKIGQFVIYTVTRLPKSVQTKNTHMQYMSGILSVCACFVDVVVVVVFARCQINELALQQNFCLADNAHRAKPIRKPHHIVSTFNIGRCSTYSALALRTVSI